MYIPIIVSIACQNFDDIILNMTNDFYGIEPKDEQEKFNEINRIAADRLVMASERLKEIEKNLLELKEVYDEEDREGRAQKFQMNTFQRARSRS